MVNLASKGSRRNKANFEGRSWRVRPVRLCSGWKPPRYADRTRPASALQRVRERAMIGTTAGGELSAGQFPE
jgi:hypothetical protein